MRVYLSGPITGTTDYIKRFAWYQAALEARGYEVVNPASINSAMPETTTHEQYMTVSLALLDTCDAIYFMPGSERSKGVQMEWQHAIETQKPDITFCLDGIDYKNGQDQGTPIKGELTELAGSPGGKYLAVLKADLNMPTEDFKRIKRNLGKSITEDLTTGNALFMPPGFYIEALINTEDDYIIPYYKEVTACPSGE